MGKKNETDLQKRVQELKEERDRTGKEPLSAKSRIQLLNEIYDGLLYCWKEHVIKFGGVGRGASQLPYQLERARLELYDLMRTHGAAFNSSQKFLGWEDLLEDDQHPEA